MFGACAGAALYRRAALCEVGGFDERYFAYLEDVDLALRLRMAGWRCAYEPAVALHAGEGSSSELSDGHLYFVARNTLLLVAKAFPLRWLPFVLYRQLSWAWHALRHGRLRQHVRGLRAALPLLPAARRERRRLVFASPVPVERAVPPAADPRSVGRRPPGRDRGELAFLIDAYALTRLRARASFTPRGRVERDLAQAHGVRRPPRRTRPRAETRAPGRARAGAWARGARARRRMKRRRARAPRAQAPSSRSTRRSTSLREDECVEL